MLTRALCAAAAPPLSRCPAAPRPLSPCPKGLTLFGGFPVVFSDPTHPATAEEVENLALARKTHLGPLARVRRCLGSSPTSGPEPPLKTSRSPLPLHRPPLSKHASNSARTPLRGPWLSKHAPLRAPWDHDPPKWRARRVPQQGGGGLVPCWGNEANQGHNAGDWEVRDPEEAKPGARPSLTHPCGYN